MVSMPIHDCPWCVSCTPPQQMGEGPRMQHGRCSDVCNNLWLADRELAQRRLNDLHQQHLGLLQTTVTNLDAVTRNLNRRVNERLDDPLQAVDDALNMAQRVNNSLARTNILMEGFYRVINEELVRRDQIVDRLMSRVTVLTDRVASLEAQTGNAGETRSRSPRPRTQADD